MRNKLLLLLLSFLWLFQLQAAPVAKGSAEHAHKIRCLVISTTKHFEVLYPKSLREIMEKFGGVEYTHTPGDLRALTVEEMLGYDVVWVYNFLPWEEVGITGEKMSTLMANYVKEGGYLMESLHIQEMDGVAKLGLLSGPYITENLSPFKPATILAAGYSNMGRVTHPEHPVMDQIHAINTSSVIYVNDVRADATTLAYYEETGAPLVSVYDNIVALNISPVDVDMTSGVGSYVFGDGHRLFHNSIKWLFSNKYDITSPNSVSNLLAIPTPNGAAFDITLEWINPSYTIEGKDLSVFSALKIYRDDVLVKTLDNPTKGAALNWVDVSVPAGSHTYKVIGVSGAKDGYPVSVKTYSGKDIPAAVHNITLAPKGNGGYITWENDVYGKNKGWIDASSLTFKIVRQPGNTTVAEQHTSKSFTDNTITAKKRYYYEITPSTVDGAGAMERSGEMYLYTNGDIYMGTSKVVTCSGKFYGPEGPDSNYTNNTAYVLCMSPENPESGNRLQVSFKKLDINLQVGSGDELYIFDGPDLDAPPIYGSPFCGQQVPSALAKVQASAKNTSGALTFGFVAGAEGSGKGWEADISCVKMADKDLAAISIKGDILPRIGTPYTYQVIVKNEGLQAQSNFEVKLFAKTPTNFVDNTTVSRSLASGDTMHIYFTWTPTEIGQNPLGALVVLENDENAGNNQSKPYVTTVQSATTVASEIKGLYDFQTSLVPWNFFAKTSVTQSIYHKNEINLAKGEIKAIRYNNSFYTEVPNEKVILHIMETDKNDLSGGWVPVASMQKVYEGFVTFPFGKNEITLVLDSPFDYKGGNLVIRAEHPRSQYYYTIGEAFEVVYDNNNAFRSLRWSKNTTEVFNEKTAEIQNGNYYPTILFTIDVKDAANIKGVITSSEGLPVDSVQVTMKDMPFTAISNAKGEYIFPSLLAGSYTLEYSKFSYITKTESAISVVDGQTMVKNIVLNEIPRAFVAGKVIDNEGLVIAGATVKLQGYDNYATTTLDDGTFKIERVYANKKYEIAVTKDHFTPYKGTFEFGDKDTTLNTISLLQIAYPPLRLKAENTGEENNVELSWKDPADMTFTRITYDNGEASTGFGVKPGVDGWFGTVFTVKDSGILESVDIYGVPHPAFPEGALGSRFVQLDIFDAHRKKIASSETFLVPYEGWINIPMNFFPYTGTFYAMVHYIRGESEADYSNYIGGDERGPNAGKQTNYYSDGYLWGVVQSMANVDPFAFLIRANVFTDNQAMQLFPGSVEEPTYEKGKTFTAAQAKQIAENVIERVSVKGDKISAATTIDNSNPFKKAYKAKYSVYRFPKNKREHISEWTLLTPSNISDKSYDDNSFGALAQGSYHYAVKASYTTELISKPMLSNLIHKDMVTTIQFTGQTNTAQNEIEGAQVRIANVDTNENYIYTGVFDAEAKLSIANVWKGKYRITISKLGFLTIDTTAVFDTEILYTFDAKMIQDKRAPYNLGITEKDEANPGAYTFTWNESKNLEEGFESHADFAINSSGKLWWTYRDGDKSLTYAIAGIEYPNQGERMAYIVFNPFQTTPPLNSLEGLPLKGKKYLVGFAAGEGMANDDWLISPKLAYTNEFTFTFNARSFSSSDGLERIQIGYSTSTTEPEDFIWIQGGQYLSIPTKWTEYSYTIPGAAKYVSIRNVGFQTYMLMIDEIFIGNEKTGESAIKGFKVYLDGVEVAQTQTKEYRFTNISNPETQKAGVRAIYESGESEISEIGFIRVGIEEDAFAKSLRVYPNPAQNYIILDGLTQNATYEIYNMYGSMVKTNTSTKNVEQISISDLSSGSYVIRIISNQGTALKRFIKK